MELKRIPQSESETFWPHFADYLIELSKYIDNVEFDQQGKPVYNRFPYYWTIEGRKPYYCMVNNTVVGFCFVRETEHNTSEIAEFSIYKPYRKLNYGIQFATLICDTLYKDIEIGVGLKNFPALAFWKKFITTYTNSPNNNYTLQKQWQTDKWQEYVLTQKNKTE